MQKYRCKYTVGDRTKTVTVYAESERDAVVYARYRVGDQFRNGQCTVERA